MAPGRGPPETCPEGVVQIVGPGLNNLDFGLFKYFHLTATNTGLQGGKLDTLGAGARTIQLGLRFDF